jgi:hypothetical protein
MSNKKKIKSVNKEKNQIPYFDYIFLIPGRQFSHNFLMCWTNTVNYLIQNNKSFFYSFKYSPLISNLRNEMILSSYSEGLIPPKLSTLKKAIPFQGTVKAKKIILIDSDMVWSVEDLVKILESPHDIAVGPYVLTDPDFSSVKTLEGKTFIPTSEILSKKEPFPIYEAGLGFTAINFNIFEEISYPWFAALDFSTSHEGEEYANAIGEDVFFFRKVHEHGGFSVVADPTIILGHEKSRIIGF